MHNGVFQSLEQVIEFYNNGGGVGHRLEVPNQTLSADSLQLSPKEQQKLISFMNTLTESVPQEVAPESLPVSTVKQWNSRKVGGEY
jgi:cytochrome c peroxidase